MNQASRETVLKAWSHPLMAGLPTTGDKIEALSHQLIHQALQSCSIPEPVLPVVRRMVHAAGDVSLAETIRFHPAAVEAGCKALWDKAPVICDVRMLQAGITRSPGRVVCKIRDKNVLRLARASNSTRAAAAMHYLGGALHNAVVAVGNAPTAIWAILELADTQGIRPALVVGTPVGFVGAAESKQALMESGLCYISNVGPRGGSPIAAAAVNALAILAAVKN